MRRIVALTDLQRAGVTGLLALAGLAAAGMIGANALVSYEQSQRAQIHFTPGMPTTIPDRRDCLNDQLKAMAKFNRQAIYNASVDCEQMIQSLEGHVEMGRTAKP
jgi:hypothetical protein